MRGNKISKWALYAQFSEIPFTFPDFFLAIPDVPRKPRKENKVTTLRHQLQGHDYQMRPEKENYAVFMVFCFLFKGFCFVCFTNLDPDTLERKTNVTGEIVLWGAWGVWGV